MIVSPGLSIDWIGEGTRQSDKALPTNVCFPDLLEPVLVLQTHLIAVPSIEVILKQSNIDTSINAL